MAIKAMAAVDSERDARRDRAKRAFSVFSRNMMEPRCYHSERAVLTLARLSRACADIAFARLEDDDFHASEHRRLFQLSRQVWVAASGQPDTEAVQAAREQGRALAQELKLMTEIPAVQAGDPVAKLREYMAIIRGARVERAVLEAATEIYLLSTKPRDEWLDTCWHAIEDVKEIPSLEGTS